MLVRIENGDRVEVGSVVFSRVAYAGDAGLVVDGVRLFPIRLEADLCRGGAAACSKESGMATAISKKRATRGLVKGVAKAPKKAARKTAVKPADAAPADGKLSALDAAAKVLGESGQPMNCQGLIAAMAAAGYWTSPGGKTPAATLNASIHKEINTKGKESRFVKASPGHFALA